MLNKVVYGLLLLTACDAQDISGLHVDDVSGIPVSGSFKGNILHPGTAAAGAYTLDSGECDIDQVVAKRKMT